MSNLISNVEPFTPEVLARRLIEQWGDQAETQAALNVDHFHVRNDNHIAKVWNEALKIITAIRLVRQAVEK
jgi:hypothetical protein